MIRVDLTRAGAAADRFRVAVVELPLSVAQEADGAVAVVDGASGWIDRARDALTAGAAATTLIAEPVAVAARAIDALDATACVVERRRLRALPSAALAAAAEARAVVVEAALPDGGAEPWLRDAIGWCRVLAGALEVEAHSRTRSSRLALLGVSSGIPVTLLASATSGHPSIVARTLGERRLEVRVDDDGTLVRIASAEGELALPRERESSARAALRRAASAGAADLSDLRHDERIRAVLSEGD